MVFSRETAVISDAVFSVDSWSIYKLDMEKGYRERIKARASCTAVSEKCKLSCEE